MLIAVAAYAGLSGFGTFVLPQLGQSLGWAPAASPLQRETLIAGLVALMAVPASIAAEAVAVGWGASSLRQMFVGACASIKTDVAFLALSHVQFTDIVGKVASLVSAVAVGRWLRGLFADPTSLERVLGALPLAAQVAIFFGVFSLLDYWAHRLYHTPVFWPLHRYHHAATDFSVINALRAHPAGVLGDFIVKMPMAALGASPAVLIYVTALAQGQSLLIHSRMNSEWGWFGRWVLMSPNHHRVHHKLDVSQPVGNFSVAPIWDHLFGTWDGAADPSLVIGVDTPYRHGLWIWPDIWRDFRDFCAAVIGRSASSPRSDNPARVDLTG
jgi:sterol desaturase/sphingolipid hydroxylase (fatty acid hydroxylase superfamily)